MVYPKQELQVRKAILEALKDCTSAETGIGYNLLFDKVSHEVGSKATFNKYLSELLHDEYITKTLDPRHKRGVVIYRWKGSELELLKLELIDGMRDIFKERDLKPIEVDEDKLGEIKRASRGNVKILINAILSIHQTLMKMLPKIKEHYGSNPYVKVFEENGKIHLDFQTD